MHRPITDEDFGHSQAKNNDKLMGFLNTKGTQRKKEFINAKYNHISSYGNENYNTYECL
jgi:hypothetical protein